MEEEDIAAVVAVLRSDWLTTGPWVERFESAFAERVGARHAVAVASGTAALHAMLAVLGIGPGDEVVVPPMTFAATANAVLYCGARPLFADVDPDTLLLDPSAVARALTVRTRAVLAVDYAGQPADYGALADVTAGRNIELLADACHSLGGRLQGRAVGSLAAMSAFSLHPVKPITAGEGGVVACDRDEWAVAMRRFRSHGIAGDHRSREREGTWFYAMESLGYNYRITDIQCALAHSQLGRLERWTARRRAIAARYREACADLKGVEPLAERSGAEGAYHLFVVRLAPGIDRRALFDALRGRGIGANVHYVPVHLHPYYREHLGTGPGLCPVAEEAYERILSLPLYPAMGDDQVERVIEGLADALSEVTR